MATRILRGVFFLARDIDRTYNATVQPQRDAHLTELVFLDHGPIALRSIAVVIAAAASGVAGTLLVRLHQTLARPACRQRPAQSAADAHRHGVDRADPLARMGRGAVLRGCGRSSAPRSHRAAARADIGRAPDARPVARGAAPRVSDRPDSRWWWCCSSRLSMRRAALASLIAASSDKEIAATMPATIGGGAWLRRRRAGARGVGARFRRRGAPPRRAVSAAYIRRSTT